MPLILHGQRLLLGHQTFDHEALLDKLGEFVIFLLIRGRVPMGLHSLMLFLGLIIGKFLPELDKLHAEAVIRVDEGALAFHELDGRVVGQSMLLHHVGDNHRGTPGDTREAVY